jgi:hypothetical protein
MLVRRAKWGSAIDDRTVNDMLNRHLAQAKTRPNAYEIPTWAIANAIRRRADNAKAVVRDGPEPPQRPNGVTQRVGPEAIAFEGARL